jgi:hypothetical protein
MRAAQTYTAHLADEEVDPQFNNSKTLKAKDFPTMCCVSNCTNFN